MKESIVQPDKSIIEKVQNGFYHKVKICGHCENFIILRDKNRKVINLNYCKKLKCTVNPTRFEGYECKENYKNE